MPDWISHQRSITISLVVLPVALSIGYLYRLNKSIQDITTAPQAGRHVTAASQGPAAPKSLPDHVKEDLSQWVVSYERVSSVPTPTATFRYPIRSLTPKASPTELLRDYLRPVHVAFSWTPQALIMRAVIKEPDLKATFNTPYINELAFRPHDTVNGLYKVSHHEIDAALGAERVELVVDPPLSFSGPPVRAVLVAAVEPSGGGEEVVFVNETWMWRAVDEPPTLLESGRGQWLHSKLAAWLVMKGLEGVSK